MNVRFYVDSATDAPHIHNHEIDEDEVIDVLTNPGEDRPGRDGSRVVIAKPKQGAIFESFTFPTLSQTAYL